MERRRYVPSFATRPTRATTCESISVQLNVSASLIGPASLVRQVDLDLSPSELRDR